MEKLNIAIADDNERMVRLLGDIVRSDEELQVIGTAKDGVEAYELIKTAEPDVVLLDIVMPKMDGFEVLNVMERKHLIEDIPVIMISSEDSDVYVRRAYELGVSDYINRPFDAKIVCQRVYNTIKLLSLIHI